MNYDWRNPISDVRYRCLEYILNKGLMKIAIWKFPQNWQKSMAEIHGELVKDGYEL